jgi:hypothetical protein
MPETIEGVDAAQLHQTMDGRVWAKEFCRVTGFQDEEWAFGWFANAIMCGFDHGRRAEEAAQKEGVAR